MIVTDPGSPLEGLTEPAHVCWVVDDDAAFAGHATSFLARGKDAGRKPLVFGSDGSLDDLASLAAVSLDPRRSVPDGGSFRPETMLTAFCEQAALAHAEGFAGVCAVVDMDSLVPSATGTETETATADVVGFELLLDQMVSRLDATVVCAYRRSSFGADAVAGARSVHGVDVGTDPPPLFRLVAGEGDLWRLSGEVDLAVADHLAAALTAATAQGRCEIDVTGLEFIDVRGMATLADAARRSATRVRLLGASRVLRHHWQLAGFDDDAPTVEFVA